MTIQTMLPADEAGLRAWSQGANEPEWLTELRLVALKQAENLEWPKLEKMKLDRWDLQFFGNFKNMEQVGSVQELPEVVHDYLDSSQHDHLLVQRNSSIVYQQQSEKLVKEGVIFTDLQTAAREYESLVRPYLFSVVDKAENKVAALHAALWSGGVFLYVPKNVEVDIPVQAMFLSDEDQVVFSPHILVIAEPNSRVRYVDHVICHNRTHSLVHNGVAEVIVKSGAHVQFASVHNLRKETTDLTYRRAVVENDGQIEWVVGEMNDGNSMSDTTTILKGHGSSSDAKVICVGTGDQKINVTTRAQHIGKGSMSDMVTRAVMQDAATGIFNGITKIEKGATDANGEQTERVLMLSPKARGDANPMLLIDEDEVKAGHAASVGQVNKDQIYYLMARGIPRDVAINLIIYGFLKPIVSEVPMENMEKQLSALVERKLGQL